MLADKQTNRKTVTITATFCTTAGVEIITQTETMSRNTASDIVSESCHTDSRAGVDGPQLLTHKYHIVLDTHS